MIKNYQLNLKTFFILICLALLSGFSNAQNCNSYPAFTTRLPGGSVKIKGDLTMIGNNIVNVKVRADGTTIDNTQPNFNRAYNGTGNNNGQTMGYIDVDGDASTFNSSSAQLGNVSSCAKVKYAYLYWAATYPYASVSNGNNVIGTGETAATAGSTRQPDWNQVKFKVPGGAYANLTADQVIWNGYINTDPNYANGNTGGCKDTPYICVKDVTSQMVGLPSLLGDYFVANIRASVGNRSSGTSAGWNLVVIYEDPNLTAKYISIFDGYQPISGTTTASFAVNGFKAVPAPQPVNATIGVAALEGDVGISNDWFEIKSNKVASFTRIFDAVNPNNNFFNSTISNKGVITTNRNPNSRNTLGVDVDLVSLPNPLNAVIPNDETGATLQLKSSGDGYGVYYSSFAIDIIEPKINLVKKVYDIAGNDITGQNVVLGQTLDYLISFQNVGNDAGASFSIKDLLPNNTNFSSVDVSGAPGVTYTYNATTNRLDFKIPNNLITVGGAVYKIKIRVQVVNSCNELKDACSNKIQNQAFCTYNGIINTNVITDDPSVPGLNPCGFADPGPSNFLVGIDECKFVRDEILCGASVVLTAANGYASYTWYDSNNVVIGTTQSITVSSLGKYKVVNSPNPPCIGITEYITVTPFGNNTTNPVIPFADEVAICPNNGNQLPKIFLCGAGDSRLIQTTINGALSIVWEKLNEASCAPIGIANCPNESGSCSWSQVGTGLDFNVNLAGQYRVTINYQNGCFNRYYFNVFSNLLDPKFTLKDIICNTNGSITITNIPSTYEFQLMDQTTNAVLVPYQSSPIFTIATAGSYAVQIRQQGVVGGCVFTLSNIGVIKRDLQINTLATDKTCNALGSIRVQALNVSPQYYYSISGVSSDSQGPMASNDYTFNNLNPGNYTVTVRTDDGCLQTTNVTIVDASTLSLTASVSQHISCKEGNIQMNASGGKTPYLYAIYSFNGVVRTITPGDYQSSVIFDIPLGDQGVYVFQVVDSNNCIALSNPVTINLVPDVVYTNTKTDVSCFGLTNGSIVYTVSATNGYSVSYQLLDSNGVLITTNASGIFTNLAPGNYTVVLVQSKGSKTCEYPLNYTITQPASAVTGTAQIVQPYTCATTGSVGVVPGSVTGGTAPYTYSINGTTFGSGTVFTGLTSGSYSITVKDANGCTFVTSPVDLEPLNPPTDLGFTNTAVTCPALKSNVTVSVILGGNAPYTYEITAPAAGIINNGNSNLFANLSPGTYTFKVTDAKGCSFQENYTISNITPINIVGTLVNNVKCLGASDGAAGYSVTGFTGTYSYTINGGVAVTNQTSNTISLNGKPAGIYIVVVTDTATNCKSTASVTIGAPSVVLSQTKVVNPITCFSQGSVVITAVGGWGGYTYQLTQPNGTIVGPQNSATFVNLSQTGTYNLTVTDSNGCKVTDTFTLSAPSPLTATIAAASDLCYDTTNQSTLVVTASGGVAPYKYSINGAADQVANTFSGLIPGSYTIIVTDSFGCTTTISQTINNQLTVATVLTKDLDCTVSPNAVITTTILGGYAPYTYQLSLNSGAFGVATAVTGNTITYSANAAGTYDFKITDSRGCLASSATTTLSSLVPPTAITSVTNVSCNGLSDGTVTVIPSLGVGPYQIRFNGGALSAQTTYTGLAAGTYAYEVIDSKSCIYNGTVTLSQPATLTGTAAITQAYTCTNVTGSIGIVSGSVTGGTAPYTYSIDGVTFGSATTFSNLTTGTYQITIKDAKGCTFVTNSLVLDPLNPPTDLIVTSSAVTCPALSSNVTVSVVNGNAPFTYEITSPTAINNGNNNEFSNLAAGTYTIKVTDAKGCTYSENYTINAITPIQVTSTLVSNVKCVGDTNGAATYTVSGFTGTYGFTINGGVAVTGQSASVINLTNQAAGSYVIVVTDETTNCTATASVTISAPAQVLAATQVVSPITCISSGSVVVSASGGWSGYTYSLTQPDASVVGPQSSATFSGLSQTGTYTINTTDANGCVVSNTFTLTTPVPVTAVLDASSDICYDTTNKSTLVVTASGGVAPYTYALNGASSQVSNTFSDVIPGAYVITVTDAFGCNTTVNVTIENELIANTVITKGLDCTVTPDATITTTIVGGKTPYNYQVSVNGGAMSTPELVTGSTITYTTALVGTYDFIVTDANGCSVASNTVTVDAITNPEITSVTQTANVLCNGDANAAISIVLDNTKGLAPFVINVRNTTTGVDYGTQTSGLTAGNYTITVTDARSCTNTVLSTITISEPAIITYVTDAQPITCGALGVSKGSIEVKSVTGGVGPYTYFISNNSGFNQTYTALTGEDYLFNVIDFGFYEVNVVDANGCSIVTQNILISSPPNDLDITIAAVANCATGGDAEVSIGGATSIIGTGPFYFAIYQTPLPLYPNAIYKPEDALGSKKATFTGLVPGVTYTFVVYDDNTKCYYFEEATTPIPTASTVVISALVPSNVTCTGSADGKVALTIANNYGVATDVTYQIFDSQTVSPIGSPIAVTIPASSNYSVPAFGSLAPGKYFVLVKEAAGATNAGCSVASSVFTISQSAVLLTVNATITKNDNCTVNGGQLTAIAQNGTAPYQYQLVVNGNPAPTVATWSGTSSNVFAAEGGDYMIYVKDANNCIVGIPSVITLPIDPSPAITATVTNQCNTAEGNFDIAITRTVNSFSPYSYSVDGGAFQVNNAASFTISNLNSGTHTIVLQDVNGCSDTTTVTIQTPLSASIAATTLSTCANNDGVIRASILGGTGTYTYELQDASNVVLVAAQVSDTFSGLASGTYKVVVYDTTTLCSASVPVTLTAPTPVSFTTTQTNVSCTSGADGTITVTLPSTNDNGPYTYVVTNGTITLTQNNGLFTGLTAGTYTVTVTSARNCSTVVSNVILTEPVLLSVSAVASAFVCDTNNVKQVATVTATASNGTAPYTYSIDGVNFASSNTFAVTDTGAIQNLTISVKDANGCLQTTPVVVTPLNSITSVAVTQTTSINCVNNTEIVNVAVTGGSGNFNYELLPSGPVQVNNGIFTFSTPGTYTIKVTDNVTGCFTQALPYVVAPFNLIAATATATKAVSCFGSNDGEMSVNVSGYTGAYTYDVLNSSNTVIQSGTGNTTTNPLVLTGLAAGNVTVRITETAAPFCVVLTNTTTIGSPAGALDLVVVSIKNDNCTLNGGQVVVLGQNGTAPYQYQLVVDGDPAPTVGTWAGSANNIFAAEGGNYMIYVKDANDCISSLPSALSLPTDPSPEITAAVTSQCNTAEGSFSIDIVRTVDSFSPYSYSIDGGAFQVNNAANFTISNINSGIHTIVIQDAKGCGDFQTVTIETPLVASIAATILPTCANNDGEIKALVSGGIGAYTYELQDASNTVLVAAQVSDTFSGLASGTYKVVIYDATTLCNTSVPVTLIAPTPVSFTTTQTNVSCTSGTDGTLTVVLAATNDNGPYTYVVTNGAVTLTQNNGLFTGLGSGTYTVTVTSARNCSTAVPNVILTEPALLVVSTSVTPFKCNSVNLGDIATITVTASGGTSPYSYSLDGTNYIINNTFALVDTGANQSITVYVKDANGCQQTTTVGVTPLVYIASTLVNQLQAISCTNDEEVRIVVTGGTGPFTYTLLPGGSPQASPDFSLSAPGSYTFHIEDTATGCYVDTVPYNVLPFNTVLASAGATKAVSCFGATDGELVVMVSGYTGTYNYEVVDALGGIVSSGTGNTTVDPMTVTGLPAGTLLVRITETNAPFCQVLTNVTTIGSPASALILIAQENANVTCSNNQGEIVALASGGWGTYQYELVNTTTSTTVQAYGSNNVFSGLVAGTYSVSVRDSGNCIVSNTVVLVQPTFITATIAASSSSVLCFGDTNASVTVSAVTGGQGSYQYALNTYDATGTSIVSTTGAQIGTVFANLGAGIYSVTISDGWGCDSTTTLVTITTPQAVVGTLTQTTALSCTLQATIQLSAIGGVAPYQYSTDGVNFTNTTTYTVGAGIYQYYVRDANGCKAVLTNQVEIEAIPTLVVGLDLSAAVINCSGDTSATIRATATGGLGNYSYTLLDSANNPIGVAQATGVFSNLAAGLYSVAVQSGDCNAVSTPITITDPPLLEVIKPVIKTDITCFGESNGSITINTTGGTGIIQYAISPNLNQFFTKNTFTDLGPGTYRILVQDQAGCFELVDVTINEPAALAATFVVDQLELCTGDANGAVTVSITGGTAPYATSIDSNNPGDYVVGKTSFTGLTGGQLYTIFVKDANNCETAVFVTLAPAVTVTILDAKVTYNCTTNLPGNTVTVTVNPEVLSSVQYSADGVVYQASNVLVNLPVGTQTIYVRHTNGCIKSVVVDILPKLPIIAAVSSIQAATCNGSATGTLTVTATGGTGALQYAISPSYVYQTANVFANLAAGTYTVRVKDDLGCEVTIGNNNVTEPSLVVATIVNAVQELCTNDANGSIEIAVAGGTAPYYTSINSNNPADFVQGKLLYTNLVGGTTYVIYVKDQNGCTTATPFTYTLNPSVDLQATTNVVVNCTGNTPGNVVTVSINPTINPASVTYALDGGAFLSTSVYTNVAVGPHSVVVRHTNGCQTTLNFTIAPVVPIAASATPQVVGCFGEATGSVSISATGGQGVLQYGISPNYVLSPNPTFANLAAGNYTVRVEDALGCFQLVPFTISQPTQLQTTLVMKMEEICDGDSDGMIEIAVTGGTAPYYTSLDPNGNFVQDLYLYDQLEGGQDYTIYVKDANGCLTQIKVTLQAPVVIDAKADVVFDCTSNVVTIQVDPSSIGNVRYSINGGALQTSNVFPALVDGDYVVDVIHNNGVCSSSVSFTIENPIPLTLTLAQTGLNEITATAKGGNGGYQYTFDGISNGTDNTYIINYSGNHEVTVTDAKGCTAKAEIKMDFIDIEIPNNFTPDGNEFNDTWAPLNTANYPNLTVAIFDRYGRKVATLGVNQSWDGTYNGEPLPTGDYWYVIKLGAANDDREFVGNFTLYR